MTPFTDAAWLASLDVPSLLKECKGRWDKYLDSGQTDDQWQLIRWVLFACREKGLEAEFMEQRTAAIAERRESQRLQARWHAELRERTPRKDA